MKKMFRRVQFTRQNTKKQQLCLYLHPISSYYALKQIKLSTYTDTNL